MRSAVLLAFVALYGCATAPGYRSSSVRPPQAFRETSGDPQPATTAPEGPHPLTPSPESPHPLSPSPSGRGGTQDEAAVSSDYWEQLGDTTLSRLVGEVLRGNLDVRSARARVSAARSDRIRSVLDLTPSATLAAGYSRQRLSSASFPGSFGAFPDQNVWDAGVNASWDLDVFGGIRDTERAQAQLSSTLASIPAREAQVAAAQYRIGTLVGRSPTEVARELEQSGQLPLLPEITSIGTPDAVVRHRPDVASAERFAAAQGALVGAAKASYLPRLTIGGTAGYAAPEFRTVGDRSTLRYAVGPVITWPGLNLGRVKAEVDAAQAREEAARAQYGRVVLAAMEDMETSLARYRAARLQVERLQEASAASERAAELARMRFREGVTDFLQVLDAERTELEAQDRLAQGRIDAATAYAALYKAVGGR